MLGLGRGMDRMFDAFGLPRITTAQLEDFAGLMRRLWQGEVVVGHDGPAGQWPVLALDPSFDEDIPLLLSAFGPHSLELAGRCFDEVLLHTFFTDETLQRCVATVKDAAERAGRDPATVKVWSCLATIGDWIPEDVRLKKTVGRLATYLVAGTASTVSMCFPTRRKSSPRNSGSSRSAAHIATSLMLKRSPSG